MTWAIVYALGAFVFGVVAFAACRSPSDGSWGERPEPLSHRAAMLTSVLFALLWPIMLPLVLMWVLGERMAKRGHRGPRTW